MEPSSPSATTTSLITYPSSDPNPTSSSSTVLPSSASRQLLKDRLYIGNLHPSVDEYTLLKIFSSFGKVTKLDFLFHKTGVLKGKPRGYAFVEYGSQDEALKALTNANTKLLRGRKLVVTFAHQAPLLDLPGSHHGSGLGRAGRNADSSKPTTLSLIKGARSSGGGGRGDQTKDKIAMMEAKLKQMERVKAGEGTALGLPAKPTGGNAHKPSLSTSQPPQQQTGYGIGPISTNKALQGSGLSSLPILPSSQSPAKIGLGGQKAKSGLVGVKISKVKIREKEKDKEVGEAKNGDGGDTLQQM